MEATTTVGNPYHYVDNNPLNRVDPAGTQPSSDSAIDALAAAGYEPSDLDGVDCRGIYPQFEGLCIETNAHRHGSLMDQMASGAWDGLKAGIASLNPFTFVRSLWDGLWSLASKPGQLIDSLRALADADPRELMDAALEFIGVASAPPSASSTRSPPSSEREQPSPSPTPQPRHVEVLVRQTLRTAPA